MPESPLTLGPFTLDRSGLALLRQDQRVEIGQRGIALLKALIEADGAVVTKAELMERVWPGVVVEEGNLTVQMAALRKALGARPDGEEWIATVPRVGYRLAAAKAEAGDGLPRAASLAVMPFENLGGDPAQDYFADGIVEDVIGALSRFRSFAVVSRNSSFAFRGKAIDVREIAQALGVRYLLEGSVRRTGERVRIAARLIDGDSGASLWAERFEGRNEDIFDFQDRITENVVGLVEPQIRKAEIERARRKRPDNLDAYDLYLKALPMMQGARAVHPENYDTAIALLEQAIALDATFAPALIHAAWAHEMRLTRGWPAPPGADDGGAAIALSERALAADGNDGVVLVLAGVIRLTVKGDTAAGMPLIRRAQAINPNSLLIANVAGYAHLFSGNYDECIACHSRFLRLSPGIPDSFWSMAGIARAHLASGRVDEALSWAQRGLEMVDGIDFLYAIAASAQAHRGELESAREILERARAIWPNLSIATIIGRTGQPEGRDRILVEGLRKAGLQEGSVGPAA